MNGVRRARPLLGTLVEVGVCGSPAVASPMAACDAAFDAIADVQRQLSRFDAGSDIARFNALPEGGSLQVRSDTAVVLLAAQRLFDDSDGAFDVSLRSARAGWQLRGRGLHKLHAQARLDLGGIGKGHAVDRAVQALLRTGAASGWVNAGGDLRSFGGATLALKLRDERRGGVVDFGRLRDGAFATSWFGTGARSLLSAPRAGPCPTRPPRGSSKVAKPHLLESAARVSTHLHVSVAAPTCLLADALTKVVAASADLHHPLLARCGARAWLH
ncbi:MAG TPA: FAD:protein FMN transferase [Burkholderiaceae bacterium]|nr:FAD:protein FMN transferase [Burkholderiaceae bacterium]